MSDDHGGEGGKFLALVRSNAEETKCCGLICLPGVFTRLYLARKVNEMIRKAKRDALLEAAAWFDAPRESKTDVRGSLMHAGHVASALRSRAKKIRIRIRGDA